MSTPENTSLQWGKSRESVERNKYYCAIVDYWGECQVDWERHRWRDWSDVDLNFHGIKPEYFDIYRRYNVEDFQFVSCIHRGRYHIAWDGPTEDGPPDHICIACWSEITEKG